MFLCAQVHNRIRELERFVRLFTVIEAQMSYTLQPTESLLKNLCSFSEFQNFSFVHLLYNKFHSGEPLQDAWKTALTAYAKHSALQKSDLERIGAFGGVFGATDITGQKENCIYFAEQLTQLCGELKKSEKSTSKLYLSLGMLGGLFIIILLL